jgi:hypothetical protein
MITKSKYVVGSLRDNGHVAAVVFCEYIPHTQMIPLFEAIRSGGFCHINGDSVSVFGESIGLGVQSIPDDERLVGRAVACQKYC